MWLLWLGLWPRANTPELVTPRLILRAPKLEDHHHWSSVRQMNRAFLQPWEPRWPRDHLTYTTFRRRVRWTNMQANKGEAYSFLLIPRGPRGVPVGGITLSNVRGAPISSATVGYWIGEEYGGQGLMTEALEAVSRFAFEKLHVTRIEAACLAENTASRALLSRCGFLYEGIARNYLEVNGRVRDHLLFSRITNVGS